MKYSLFAATMLLAFSGQFAQAMPISPIDNDARPLLVRDGCGPDRHIGGDGYCHHDHDWPGWDRPHGPPPGYYYSGPRYYEPPPRRFCPPGYHLGRFSGVCRPNDY